MKKGNWVVMGYTTEETVNKYNNKNNSDVKFKNIEKTDEEAKDKETAEDKKTK